jgi:hypothetical protein
MAGSISIGYLFQNQVGPVPLVSLDQNFAQVSGAINELSTFSNYYVDFGFVNALVVTLASNQTYAGNVPGVQVQVKPAYTNTSNTVTLSVAGAAALQVVNADGSSLSVGQIVAGQISCFVCTGSSWQLYSASTSRIISAPVAGSSLTVNALSGGNIIKGSDGVVGYFWATSTNTSTQFGTTSNHAIQFYVNNLLRATISTAGTFTVNAGIGVNGNTAPTQITGWGSPTGAAVVANFSGASATLVQCSNAIAQIISDLKNIGFYAA